MQFLQLWAHFPARPAVALISCINRRRKNKFARHCRFHPFIRVNLTGGCIKDIRKVFQTGFIQRVPTPVREDVVGVQDCGNMGEKEEEKELVATWS
jgi:hypothetical protein